MFEEVIVKFSILNEPPPLDPPVPNPVVPTEVTEAFSNKSDAQGAPLPIPIPGPLPPPSAKTVPPPLILTERFAPEHSTAAWKEELRKELNPSKRSATELSWTDRGADPLIATPDRKTETAELRRAKSKTEEAPKTVRE
jgi:hypothetical protein